LYQQAKLSFTVTNQVILDEKALLYHARAKKLNLHLLGQVCFCHHRLLHKEKKYSTPTMTTLSKRRLGGFNEKAIIYQITNRKYISIRSKDS